MSENILEQEEDDENMENKLWDLENEEANDDEVKSESTTSDSDGHDNLQKSDKQITKAFDKLDSLGGHVVDDFSILSSFLSLFPSCSPPLPSSHPQVRS